MRLSSFAPCSRPARHAIGPVAITRTSLTDCSSNPNRQTGRGFVRAIAVAASLFVSAHAGQFGVSPIRLDLDRNTRSAVITVSNQGDSTLGFQVRAAEWTQDESGADRYLDSNELIFFPQQLQVPAGESRVVRVGMRNPARQNELAYRVFIEELVAPPEPGGPQTAAVAMAVRFGVPVFVLPANVVQKGEIAEFTVSGGKIRGELRNAGTVHFRPASVRVRGLDAEGATAFEHVFDGWYLLVSTVRRYEAPVPAEACRKARSLRVEVTGEKLELKSDFPLPPGACGP